MLLITFAGVFYGSYAASQRDIGELRSELGIIQNCELARGSRLETNKQRAVFHAYLINQRKISQQEQPFLEPFFNQFGPGLKKLLNQSEKLQDKLIAAEVPLKLPVCRPGERP